MNLFHDYLVGRGLCQARSIELCARMYECTAPTVALTPVVARWMGRKDVE
jgi:hypothetical protein